MSTLEDLKKAYEIEPHEQARLSKLDEYIQELEKAAGVVPGEKPADGIEKAFPIPHYDSMADKIVHGWGRALHDFSTALGQINPNMGRQLGPIATQRLDRMIQALEIILQELKKVQAASQPPAEKPGTQYEDVDLGDRGD